jgi:DUF971 family protein
MVPRPSRIEVIGDTLSMLWDDGNECFLDASFLRSHSPSAENQGETDIFGKVSGGTTTTEFSNVKILKVSSVGNYAIRILFSDGHSTGIYSWDYLRKLEKMV